MSDRHHGPDPSDAEKKLLPASRGHHEFVHKKMDRAIEDCCNPTAVLDAPITTATVAKGSTSIPYGEDFSGVVELLPFHTRMRVLKS